MTDLPVLIVEDDEDISELIKIQLEDSGYSVEQVYDGLNAYDLLITEKYSIVILDIMLPRLNGFELCKRIRKKDISIPVLMLTAKSEEIDKIIGLEIGADDYLTKPFSTRELTARVKALLRRSNLTSDSTPKSQDSYHFAHLSIFLDKRKVELNGNTLNLTSKEFDLLLLFAENPGRVYSREQLLDAIWGYQYDGYSHTVNSHINRLRSKIEADPANPTFIKTVWGVGYRFAEQHELGHE